MTKGEYTRSPILTVLGHVDVGKTTLLDKIRGTAVVRREPGMMTQHIGASFLPWKSLEKLCGPLARSLRADIKIPGLLVIDTPGHEAFVNLRRRGGSIADMAILVVDINRGFEQQTYEAVEILRSRRTPFIVAANKVDRIPGWRANYGEPFVSTLRKQPEDVMVRLEELIAYLIGQLESQGFRADRYDRVRDFSRVVAIVPTSAVTGEGIPDLLLVVAGLAQRFLIKHLRSRPGPGRGVILEVKEEVGLGTTIASIIYEGRVRRGDTIVVGGMEEPIVTKVKALLMPKPLDEMRSPRDKFLQVDEVRAAAGVMIVATGLDLAVAGAPVVVVGKRGDLDRVVTEVREEISSLKVSRNIAGVVVKADTLGTLEALLEYLEKNGVPVRYADVGPVVKRDVVEASLTRSLDRLLGVILAFNVRVTEEAEVEASLNGIRIFTNNIVYRLVEDFLEWYNRERELERRRRLEKLVLPAAIEIIPGFIFRRSNPAIVGVRVLFGKIRRGTPLITSSGRRIGEIMQIQDRGRPLDFAEAGREVAVSIRGRIIVGRQVKEGDVLYSDVPMEHIDIILDKYSGEFTEVELEYLKKLKMLRLGIISKVTIQFQGPAKQ